MLPGRQWRALSSRGVLWAEYHPVLCAKRLVPIGWRAVGQLSLDGRSVPLSQLEVGRECAFRLAQALVLHQIRHRPRGEALTLELNADCAPHREALAFWERALGAVARLSVAVPETATLTPLVEALHRAKVPLTLEAPSGLVAQPRFWEQCETVTFSGSWLEQLRLCATTRGYLDALLRFAREAQQRTVLTGLRRRTHVRLARSLAFDAVQGPTFSTLVRRSPVEPLEAASPAEHAVATH